MSHGERDNAKCFAIRSFLVCQINFAISFFYTAVYSFLMSSTSPKLRRIPRRKNPFKFTQRTRCWSSSEVSPTGWFVSHPLMVLFSFWLTWRAGGSTSIPSLTHLSEITWRASSFGGEIFCILTLCFRSIKWWVHTLAVVFIVQFQCSKSTKRLHVVVLNRNKLKLCYF